MHPVWLVSFVALLTAVAGCVSDAPTPPSDEEGSTAEPVAANQTLLPESMATTIDITPGFDIPLPVGDEAFCWMPTASCVSVPFELPGGADVTIHLSWTVDANNIGLFLYEGDEMIAADTGPRPIGTSATIETTLTEGGTFAAVIDPHWAAVDTAELTITFA